MEIMKRILSNIHCLGFLISLSFIYQGCEKDSFDNNSQDNHKLVVLPENPTINDNIKIVEEICTYETLKPLEISGEIILEFFPSYVIIS